MPARDYDLLQRYWLAEPWGAWRDNVHTAIVAAELRRPYLKKGVRVQLDDFMLRHPDELAEERNARRRKATGNLFQMLKAIATRKPNG